ncbi:MAG: hypothetical protein K6A89_11570, partial [Treponema sp.]|nr:hypothetical protein [Treponema sp.]
MNFGGHFSLKLLCTVLYTVLIFSSLHSQQYDILSQDIYRFVFKFYYSVPYDELISTLDSEIKKEYPDFSLRELNILDFSNSSSSPGNLLRFIESYLRSEKYKVPDVAENLEIQDFYIVFIEDSKKNPESAFGHVGLLIDDNNSFYFDTVISFLAENFIDSNTGKIHAGNYFKGGFYHINADVVKYPFFDLLYT